jgi:hypothetical protein
LTGKLRPGVKSSFDKPMKNSLLTPGGERPGTLFKNPQANIG